MRKIKTTSQSDFVKQGREVEVSMANEIPEALEKGKKTVTKASAKKTTTKKTAAKKTATKTEETEE